MINREIDQPKQATNQPLYVCLCQFQTTSLKEFDEHIRIRHNDFLSELIQTQNRFNTSKIFSDEDKKCALGKPNVMPEGQGKRDIKRPRHDLIPIEFLDELASIFEEGLYKYGNSWKKGGSDFLTDCLNHASNHLHLAMNGDTNENNLVKVAWNCLAVRWHQIKKQNENKSTPSETAR